MDDGRSLPLPPHRAEHPGPTAAAGFHVDRGPEGVPEIRRPVEHDIEPRLAPASVHPEPRWRARPDEQQIRAVIAVDIGDGLAVRRCRIVESDRGPCWGKGAIPLAGPELGRPPELPLLDRGGIGAGTLDGVPVAVVVEIDEIKAPTDGRGLVVAGFGQEPKRDLRLQIGRPASAEEAARWASIGDAEVDSPVPIEVGGIKAHGAHHVVEPTLGCGIDKQERSGNRALVVPERRGRAEVAGHVQVEVTVPVFVPAQGTHRARPPLSGDEFDGGHEDTAVVAEHEVGRPPALTARIVSQRIDADGGDVGIPIRIKVARSETLDEGAGPGRAGKREGNHRRGPPAQRAEVGPEVHESGPSAEELGPRVAVEVDGQGRDDGVPQRVLRLGEGIGGELEGSGPVIREEGRRIGRPGDHEVDVAVAVEVPGQGDAAPAAPGLATEPVGVGDHLGEATRGGFLPQIETSRRGLWRRFGHAAAFQQRQDGQAFPPVDHACSLACAGRPGRERSCYGRPMRARLPLLATFTLALSSALSPSLHGDVRAAERRGGGGKGGTWTAADMPALLTGRILLADRAWHDLRALCDGIGHRLSGSPQLDRAIEWGRTTMERAGLKPVRIEPVTVPRWHRGESTVDLLEPSPRSLPHLMLGMSVGTQGAALEAEVLTVSSFAELAALPDERVRGRAVLFDVPFTTYGETVAYRSRGAIEAARRGAVASFVRSVTPESLATPHTGTMGYAEDVPRIPAAALTTEDAAALHRMQDAGLKPRLRLRSTAEHLGDAPSGNVVGDVRGRERPEEVVLLACHLDSWDVGQGAQDDGAGCAMILEAGRALAGLPIPPRRTVRVVLFTNEENGLAGGKAYAAAHPEGAERHVAALEADLGAGRAFGWTVDVLRGPEGPDRAAQRIRATEALQWLGPALAPLGAGRIQEGGSGADTSPLVERGVLGLGFDQDASGYWRIHHTEADTFEKVDPAILRQDAAIIALTAWSLAEAEALP